MTDADPARIQELKKRVVIGITMMVRTIYRPFCTMALGLAMSGAPGWLKWILGFACFLFIAEGALMTWWSTLRERPRPEPQVVVETWTLEGKEAKQLHDQLKAATSKQRSEPLQ